MVASPLAAAAVSAILQYANFVRAGSWQNAFFCADFYFELPDFFADFVAGFLSHIFVGKGVQKNPPGKSPANSSKYDTTKSPTHFCRGARPNFVPLKAVPCRWLFEVISCQVWQKRVSYQTSWSRSYGAPAGLQEAYLISTLGFPYSFTATSDSPLPTPENEPRDLPPKI